MDKQNEEASIVDALRDIQRTQAQLLATVESIAQVGHSHHPAEAQPASPSVIDGQFESAKDKDRVNQLALTSDDAKSTQSPTEGTATPTSPAQKAGFSSRIILTLVLP